MYEQLFVFSSFFPHAKTQTPTVQASGKRLKHAMSDLFIVIYAM